MIRITVELFPFGIENHPQKKEIGRIEISNDGKGDASTGNYDVRLYRRGSKNIILKEGKVIKHKRHVYSIWKLVAKALKSVGF